VTPFYGFVTRLQEAVALSAFCTRGVSQNSCRALLTTVADDAIVTTLHDNKTPLEAQSPNTRRDGLRPPAL